MRFERGFQGVKLGLLGGMSRLFIYFSPLACQLRASTEGKCGKFGQYGDLKDGDALAAEATLHMRPATIDG